MRRGVSEASLAFAIARKFDVENSERSEVPSQTHDRR